MLAALFSKDAPDAEPEIAYLWPDNIALWGHWTQVQTEWRSDMAGGMYFDFGGLRNYLDETGITGDERKETSAAIREAVRAILADRAEAREQKANNP